jgi:hypothetical protein
MLMSKRKKVKCACLPCIKAKTGCDSARPCLKCVKRGIADQCIDRAITHHDELVVQAIIVEDSCLFNQLPVLARAITPRNLNEEQIISVGDEFEFLSDLIKDDSAKSQESTSEIKISAATGCEEFKLNSRSRRVSSFDIASFNVYSSDMINTDTLGMDESYYYIKSDPTFEAMEIDTFLSKSLSVEEMLFF